MITLRVPIYVSLKATEVLKAFNKIIGKSDIIKNRLAGCIDALLYNEEGGHATGF